MAMEKDKALCHPYPNIKDKIDKYGYDGKQLSHCARLYEFIVRFKDGTPIAAAYKTQMRDYLMDLKKNKLELHEAVMLSKSYCKKVMVIF